MKPHHVILMDQEYEIRGDMVEALQRYVEQGLQPGGFLTAVLANDLVEACQRADYWNLPNLPAYAHYVYWEMPSACHGSYEAVDAWIERGGLKNANATAASG